MDIEKAIEKAAALIEALPYIQRFRGDTVVVKLGGSLMEHPDALKAILRDVAFMECVGLRPVVVHGGGKNISRALEAKGIEPKFHHGLRVTDDAVINVVEEVLNHEVNRELVEIVESFECKALGIHGNTITWARPHTMKDPETGEELDWGFVGEVEEVNPTPILEALDHEIVPVVTPLGRDDKGNLYNINADEAAAAIARKMKARKLVFLSDVPGILENPEDKASLISSVTLAEVEQHIEEGVIQGGMLPKVKGALEALKSGVRKTHIIDSSMPHSLLLELFTDEGVGTQIVLDEGAF